MNGYFDWAATAMPDSEILKYALEKSLEFCGNPSSVHKIGIDAKNELNKCRKECANVLGVHEDTIYFTSGGTEADCIPIVSLLQRPVKGSIVISAIEHPAVREQANALKNSGWRINIAKANTDGIITPEAVLEAMDIDTALVCIMAVNNETGAIQPINEIGKAIAEKSVGHKKPKFHVDAVQSIGKINIDFSQGLIDTAAISGHKICGPRGIGILYMKQRQEPFLRGGGQESGIRSGTENLFGIIALTECLKKYASKNIVDNNLAYQYKECEAFIKKIVDIKGASIVPPSRQEKQELFSPFVIQVAFKNIPGEVMVRALSEKGFYISTGSACSAKRQYRPILEAMKTPVDIAASSVRFSFGLNTNTNEVEELLKAIKDICQIFN